MSAHVALRQRAVDDADSAVAYLEANAPFGTAGSFVDALEEALDHLARHPLTGALRFAFELGIPDLRTWPLGRFPYLIFYVADAGHVDVWRVLHAHRDIPASLAPGGPEPSQ